MLKEPFALLLVLMAFMLSACATRVTSGGHKETRFDPRYLAKTEIDRVIDTDRAEVMSGMRRVAEKLYKRNPKEWKKSGQPSAEAALGRLFYGGVDFPELEGRREGAAALFAFSPNYTGDRVLGVMAGLLWLVNWSDSWLDAARGHADRFNWPVGQIEAQLRAAGYDGKAPIIANRHIGGGLLRSRFPEAHVTVCDIERWDAELCVQDTTHHARQQGRRWWLVAVEDAPSAGWWDAAEPADGPAATPHSVALPFRFSHDGKPTLSLQYLAQADSVRTPKQ